MSLMTLYYYRRWNAAGLLLLFLSLIIDVPVLAQEKSAGEAHGTNVKWTIKDDLIVITYDLNGTVDDKYDVSLTMRKENDDKFNVVPATVEGAIGDGQLAGLNRAIRWYFLKDIPQGFQGEGYYFEILVKPVPQKSNLLYYVIGGAAATIGIIALLVGGNSPENSQPTYLPFPPARP